MENASIVHQKGPTAAVELQKDLAEANVNIEIGGWSKKRRLVELPVDLLLPSFSSY
jgi:hypothetical protein